MRIVGLLVVVVVILFLGLKELQGSGQSPAQITSEVQQGSAAVAGTNLQSAASILQASFVGNGTYAGAEVSSAGVTLVRADATSYCVQTTLGAPVEHLTGPNGTPQPGPC
jgi:hypothetical protein